MEKDFEREVLERLTKIETKLDDYGSLRDKVESTYALSKENEKEISEIQEKLKWITRTIVGALITGLVGIAFIIIQIGMGIK